MVISTSVAWWPHRTVPYQSKLIPVSVAWWPYRTAICQSRLLLTHDIRSLKKSGMVGTQDNTMLA